MRHLLALIVILSGCTDTFLELHPAQVALGAGLTAPYRPQVTTCDPGDAYPAGCDQDLVNVQRVKARGAVAVELGDDGGFWATGLVAGDGEVEISAGGFDEQIEIDVAPAAYSIVTWWGSDANPLFNTGLDAPLVMFTGTQIELWQMHYRETLDELALTPLVDLLDVVLHGHSKYVLAPGTAEVTLVELGKLRPAAPYPRIAVQGGATPGAARVSTLVGGELAVLVVDETAVASLAGGIEYHRLGISPRDAQGQTIRGCPAGGPSISDTAGILVATRRVETASCQFELALAPGKTWQETTLVATWNQVELRVPVARW